MSQYILFEDPCRNALLPLTFMRPVYELRCGIFTFKERWEQFLGTPISHTCEKYLAIHWASLPSTEQGVWVNGRMVPNENFLKLLEDIPPNTYIYNDTNDLLCARFSTQSLPKDWDGILSLDLLERLGLKSHKEDIVVQGIACLSDIFRLNEDLIRLDFDLITRTQRSSAILDPYTRIYAKDNIFVAQGAKIRAATLNAEAGPIFIGPYADIQEGAIIKGAHSIGAYAKVGPGAKLRGDSCIGPYSKIGGEVTNSVIMGWSNKAHEGYLGNSILGYWCNLGADTNTSNLKNNYSSIKQWSYPQNDLQDTGLKFCGLVMGDHSKSGINTMFNTGTVVGVSSNVFGAGFTTKFIPSFSWGGPTEFSSYRLDKALEVMQIVMSRRKKTMSEAEVEIAKEVHTRTARYRNGEKALAV